jgi:hypothetical protein
MVSGQKEMEVTYHNTKAGRDLGWRAKDEEDRDTEYTWEDRY